MFTYDYYLFQFLLYNNRRCCRDWRNKTEEELVKQHEEIYAALAAAHMPPGLVSSLIDETDIAR